MYKRMIIGATALALLAGVAFAAQDAPPPAPSQDNGQAADNGQPSPPPPGDGQDEGRGGGWKKWMGHRGHGHGMRGPEGRGGPGGMGMMMHMKGFRMHLGRGINVDVACGEEAMKDCIASAQPLIDAAKAASSAQPTEAPKAP